MHRTALLVGLVSLAGCPSLGAYQCERDGDCNRNGAAGRCLADAACAYPENDGRCESGWARSPNAAEEPGACIPEEPPATSGPSMSSSGPDPSTTADDASSGAGETGTSPCSSAVVTVDTTTLSPGSGLDGFVLWFPLTDWPKGAARITSDAYDLRITDPNGTSLPFERRDLLDGTPALWIKLPDFAVEETVELRFLFGPDLSTPDTTEVWRSDYLGVWHLDDAPMGFDGDASRNSAEPTEPGQMNGDMQPEQRVDGVLGPAIAFDGVDDMIVVDASFRGQLDAYTISLWGRVDGALEPPSQSSFFQRLNGDYFYPRCWHGTEGEGRLYCQHSVGGTIASTSTRWPLEEGTFYHLALVRDPEASRTTLFIQGEALGSFEDPPGATLDTERNEFLFELGHGEWGSLLGVLDEVRVSGQVLSPERLRADYRSQAGGLQFLTYGEILPASCPQ